MRFATVLRASTLAIITVAAMLRLGPGPVLPAPAEAEETFTVLVGNIWFCDESYQYDYDPNYEPCETVVHVGDTVV
jgi:hypothetical protein